MDIIVTLATDGTAWDGAAWDLTDLLGRSMGRIVEEPYNRFTIQPDGRALETMDGIATGPYPSLDAALSEIKNTRMGFAAAPQRDVRSSHEPEPESGGSA